jgi:hypothetical protein
MPRVSGNWFRTGLWGVILLAGCADADDRSARWPYVHAAIIRPSCTSSNCHSKLGSQGGVDLSTPDAAFVLLTGTVCGAPDQPGAPAGNFVRPGHPESSELVRLLRGDGGLIMPPDSPLPEVEIEIVERWILEGAACE